MSTRRTTRAGSRAASSVGGAYAVGPDDIPVGRTPGRGRPRKSGGSVAGSERSNGLPTMAATSSTAYGTNTLALPNYGPRGAPLANDISSVIEGLLEPEPPKKGTRLRPGSPREPVPDVDASAAQAIPGAPAYTPTMRSRSGPVKRRVPAQTFDRNFQNESQLFDNASILSTSYQQDDYLNFSGPPLDEGEINRRSALRDILEEQQYMRGGARDETFSSLGEGITTNLREFLRAPVDLSKKIAKSLFSHLTASLLPLLFLGLVAFIAWIILLNSGGPSIHWYGSDIAANLGQFIPSQIKHPSRLFAPEDLRDVYRRLDIAESDINFLKHRSTIDKNALAEIEKILPDFIALEKDYNGQPTLPANLWQAMRERIRADPALIPTAIRTPHEESPSDPSRPDTTSDSRHEIFNSKEFDRYLESNRLRIQSWAGSEFDALHQARLDQLIKDGKIASRTSVVELIKENWKQSALEVKSELLKLTKDLEMKVANLGTHALTAQQVKALANEVVRAQIEAISNANVNKNAGRAINRKDHFAKRSHSAVIPRLTTPSYRFPHMDFGFVRRTLAFIVQHPIPLPNPADAALTAWEEIGDCWCSPQQNGDGPTLGVMTPHNVTPDQVVVEHFPQSGYANSGLSPGSTPQKMQLLAYIYDKPTFLKVKAQSDQIFPENKDDAGPGDGWVQVGEWAYDAYGSIVQVFPLQIDLKDFTPAKVEGSRKDLSATNKYLIRVKSNYGNGLVPYTCLYRSVKDSSG
ncbi:hypothetical protein EYC84_000145 [Monilinia fructicola]|uniref:SUN domain-containing protein n=1 Tax=Monilinia fructicola TaxID=38448 RepID=A0A5M9JQ23_MONFR|nr:hypothetical protein EYC84_000145 [Monilinia fructicola]